jgi:hypothetical protein
MDLPKVKFPQLLTPPESGSHLRIMETPPGRREAAPEARPHKLLRGAEEIFYNVVFFQRTTYSENRGFLTAVMKVAVEDLEDAQTLQ